MNRVKWYPVKTSNTKYQKPKYQRPKYQVTKISTFDIEEPPYGGMGEVGWNSKPLCHPSTEYCLRDLILVVDIL